MKHIPLTREMIDHIFEPRRAIRTAQELEAAAGRLLTDGKGHYYALERTQKRPARFAWVRSSRPAPDPNYEYGHRHGYKKGTWPAWVSDSGMVEMNDPWRIRPYDDSPVYECLPEPITQGEILLAFYHIAFPDYDDIVKIENYPTVSSTTWKYIWNKFAAFDRRMFPSVMPGGAWALGCGFSSDREKDGKLPDWVIDISTAECAYTWTPYFFRITRSDWGPDEDPKQYQSFYPRRVWATGLYSSLENSDGLNRRDTFDQAVQDCRKVAGCALDWHEIESNSDAAWQSQTIAPMRKAA